MLKKIIMKNSGVGFLSQIFSMVFQFVCRKIFIDYFGVEILGISSTYTYILNTLSLAELGVQNAIIFSLYKPLNEDDRKTVNDVLNVFKLVYRFVAGFIAVAAVVCIPLLPRILSGVQIGGYVYAIFAIQVLTSVSSYLLAYKRTLLYADQKAYIAGVIDLVFIVIFNTAEIIAIICTENYYIYFLLKLLYTVTSNLGVHLYCARHYPYLHRDRVNLDILRTVYHNVRNIFASKIAGYIYGSTDNILISAFISTATVGYFTNYATVKTSIRSLLDSFLRPVVPIIGREINKGAADEIQTEKKYFRMYSDVRYLVACVFIIPTYLLMDNFIGMWVGKAYILPKVITILILVDLYIDIVHSSTIAFIEGKGLFAVDKKLQIIGAVSNITISLACVKPLGLPGILFGTVVSQCIYWMTRSYVVYHSVFHEGTVSYLKYWVLNFMRILLFLVECAVASLVCRWSLPSVPLLEFVLKGFLIEGVVLTVSTMCFWHGEFRLTVKQLMKR